MLSFPARFDKKLMKEMLEQKLLEYMRRGDYRPLNKSELARVLEVESKDRSELRKVLRRLENAGVLLAAKKGRFVLCEADEKTVVGTYRRRVRDGELAVAKGEGGTTRHVIIHDRHADTAMESGRLVYWSERFGDRMVGPPWSRTMLAFRNGSICREACRRALPRGIRLW